MIKRRRVAYALLWILAALAAFALIAVSFAGTTVIQQKREIYRCVWSDGSATQEDFASAYAVYDGATEEEILLRKDSLTGKISAGESYRLAVETLEKGELADLLNMTEKGLSRIERAALFHKYATRLYYADDWFGYTGQGVRRVPLGAATEVVFMTGELPDRALAQTGATTLYVQSGAQLSAKALSDSCVEEVFVQSPYSAEGGAVYRDGVAGRRLVAGLPAVRSLRVEADYIDEGALSPCRNLEELDLPFIGSSADRETAAYDGDFGYLFDRDGDGRYVIPAVRRLIIRGGRIQSHAFYGAFALNEIDVCGVLPENIDRTAFDGLKELRLLHCPKEDVVLMGDFTSYQAPCGCTVFVRNASDE